MENKCQFDNGYSLHDFLLLRLLHFSLSVRESRQSITCSCKKVNFLRHKRHQRTYGYAS